MDAPTTKRRRTDGGLRFGLMWPGSPAAFAVSAQVAAHNPDPLDAAQHVRLARAAETAGVDFAFFADGYSSSGPEQARVGHQDPVVSAMVWAPVVMGATRHLGVVTTMHTRYHHPVVLAKLGANYDVLSGGRWGWNVVPGANPDEAELFGIDDVEHDRRYAMAAETVDAVKALWAADGSRVEFTGEFHRFAGTPRGPGPLQRPWPLLFSAGVSPAGQDFTAAHCDYVFTTVADDLDRVRDQVGSLADRVAARGRDPLSVTVAGAVGVVAGRTEAEAADRYAMIVESLDLPATREKLALFTGVSQTYAGAMGDLAADAALRSMALALGSRVLVGTPAGIAEQILSVRGATGLRGFVVMPILWAEQDVALLGEVFARLRRSPEWTPPAERGWSW